MDDSDLEKKLQRIDWALFGIHDDNGLVRDFKLFKQTVYKWREEAQQQREEQAKRAVAASRAVALASLAAICSLIATIVALLAVTQ